MPVSESTPFSEKLEDGWRMVCPEGHHDLEDKKGPTVFCRTCYHAYRSEDLIDKVREG
jgi:hypothetical protein